MKITIKQTIIASQLVQTIDGLDLHKELEINKDYSDWIKAQIKRAGLIQNEDYLKLPQKGELSATGQTKIDYFLTVESGKHIAMMSQSKKGKDVRDYFINCEKRLKAILLKQQKQQFDLEWQAVRDMGKLSRKSFTDCAEELTELIRSQNPDSSYLKRKDAVYEAMTVAVYAGLGINTERVRFKKLNKTKNYRNAIDKRHLTIVDFCERLLPDMIRSMIVENAGYKFIMAAIKTYAQQFKLLLNASSGTAVSI